MQFMALLSKALHNENVIREIRNAELKKAEVDSKVLDSKQELQNVMIQLDNPNATRNTTLSVGCKEFIMK
jgi:hypothetical protein